MHERPMAAGEIVYHGDLGTQRSFRYIGVS
jgi:hypothetical protein